MKKNELEILITGLRNLSEDAAKIAIALSDLSDDEPEKKGEPERVYTYEDVRKILAKISKEHRDKVKAIVSSHGESSLSAYKDKPDILAAIVKEAEVITDA